jgi:hypothetical protein
VTAAPALPPRYRTWLVAVGASLLGTQVLAFGMAWDSDARRPGTWPGCRRSWAWRRACR